MRSPLVAIDYQNMQYKLFAVFILLLACSFSAYSQDALSGHVIDAESGVDIQGAIVSGRSESGGMVRYVVTDGSGRFSLTVSGVSYVEVSLLGYRKETLRDISSGSVTVKMETAAIELAKAVVSAGVVEVQGDTIRYEASAMVKKSDRVLGDFLERLPGIEVSEAGKISYGGKGINRLYIDGRNVLDKDYDVATRNLDVNAVKAVSIYENHQPIKALRGAVRSRSAAIDIELKEESRNHPILNLEASAGSTRDTSSVPFEMKASLFSLSKMSSHVYELNADAIGHLSQRSARDAFGSEMDAEDRLSVSRILPDALSGYSSLIDRSYTQFNHSYGVRANDRFSIGEDVFVGTRLAYSKDDFSGMSGQRLVYSSPEMELLEVRRGASGSDSFTAGLNIESNKASGYVRDDLELLYDRHESQSSLSGTRTQEEAYGNDALELNNTFNLTLRRRNGRTVTGHLYTQYNTDDGLYSSLSAGERSQTYKRDLLWNRMVFSSTSDKRKDFSYSVTPSATLLIGSMESLASGDLPTFEGKAGQSVSSLLNFNPELAISALYERPHFSGMLMGRARLRMYQFFGIGGSERNKTIFTPMLISLVEYRETRMRLSNNIVIENGIMPGDLYSGALFLTGYNTCRRDIDTPISLPTVNMRSSFEYRDPINGFYSNVDFNVGGGSMLSSAREITDNWILTRSLPAISSFSTWGPSFKISKNIISLGLKTEISGSYDDMSGRMIQNGVGYGYHNGSIALAFDGEISPLGWLNVSSNTSWSMSRIGIKGIADSNAGHLRSITTVNIHLSESVSLDSILDYIDQHGLSHSDFLMLNASVSWAVSQNLNLSFKMLNIGNRRSFESSNITPLVESVQTVMVRPTCFLVGLTLHK